MVCAASSDTDALTLRWARSQDATTLDPHVSNTGANNALLHSVYETLVIRDGDGVLVPALSVSWQVLPDDPTVWEFKLRPDVRFHDGSAFTAEDVVFSLARARAPGSDWRSVLLGIETVIAVDVLTVRIKTASPDALLIDNLSTLFMLDRGWSETHGVAEPQNPKDGGETYATRHANGTGPYLVTHREPGERTVLTRNEAYWGRREVPLAVSEIVYRPIPEHTTRIAALLSNEVDFVQDVPAHDIERLKAAKGIKVDIGAENRVIFLGFNLGRPELASSDVKGRNPFGDQRVREAVNLAINREAIRQLTMRGHALPVGILATPLTVGWTAELGAPPPFDPAKAKRLLAEAGYQRGFTVTLHCTNDRYVNDEGICQSVVGMLRRIGIRTRLVTQSHSVHFLALHRGECDLFLLGWGIITFDSSYVFTNLYRTRTATDGAWNVAGYSNPDIDNRIAALGTEVDRDRRKAAMVAIWQQLREDTVYVPLHVQSIAYAMRNGFDIRYDVTNHPKIKNVAAPKP
ncbi:ABC transporter substrate-binding protein [Blastochloris viridis]|nr:ABC transporter substrate-binding protein [Blastochloris viridis]